MSNGSVYIFNVNGEAMSVITIRGNASSDTIPGWSTGAGDMFTPHELKVPRVKLPINEFAFAQGSNIVTYQRPTFNGVLQVNIPPTVSLADDLILYLTLDLAILMRTSGEVIDTIPYKANTLIVLDEEEIDGGSYE